MMIAVDCIEHCYCCSTLQGYYSLIAVDERSKYFAMLMVELWYDWNDQYSTR